MMEEFSQTLAALRSDWLLQLKLSLKIIDVSNTQAVMQKLKKSHYNQDWKNVLDGFLDLFVYLTGAIYKYNLTASKNHFTNLYKLFPNLEPYITRICYWNELRNNQTFNFMNELAFIFEETYELRNQSHKDSRAISLEIVKNLTFDKELTPQVQISFLEELYLMLIKSLNNSTIPWLDYLKVVLDANDTKGIKKDAYGKILKDKTTFVEPESQFK